MNHATTPPQGYHRRREHQERAAADRAASDEARRIHLDLADRYAALSRS